jgi:hypothetical protein
MASLNFDESIVLILFAQADGSLDPSRESLTQFDAELQRTFGAKLLQIMTDEGMDPDVHNRSVVLGCRQHMPGNTADVQIRNACKYVLHAQQQLGAPAIAAFTALRASGPVAPASVKKAAKGGRGRRKSPVTSVTRRTKKSQTRPVASSGG